MGIGAWIPLVSFAPEDPLAELQGVAVVEGIDVLLLSPSLKKWIVHLILKLSARQILMTQWTVVKETV